MLRFAIGARHHLKGFLNDIDKSAALRGKML